MIVCYGAYIGKAENEMIDGLIGMPELCNLLGVGRTTIYRMIDDGRLPQPAKMGGDDNKKARVVWRESVINKVLDDIMPSADA